MFLDGTDTGKSKLNTVSVAIYSSNDKTKKRKHLIN